MDLQASSFTLDSSVSSAPFFLPFYIITIMPTCNTIICSLCGFASVFARSFGKQCACTLEMAVVQPPLGIYIDFWLLSLIRGRGSGSVQPYLASHCPIISVKDHRPSGVRIIHRVSSPLPLVNLTGAARSGFWPFRNPTGVFVFEWAMMPMNGGDPSVESMSLQ